MKKLFLIITCFFASVYLADAQQLNLVADAAYGKSNDWDKIFDTYYDTFYDMPIGLRKNLVVLHDGKAIVSHATRNRYSLFDENGKFLKDIKLHFIDESRKPYNIQHVAGEINGMFFTYANNMGDIYFF